MSTPDPVGTVRRDSDGMVWVRVAHAVPLPWWPITHLDGVGYYRRGDDDMAGSGVIGEVPGTPAARRTIRVQWAEAAIREAYDRVYAAVMADGDDVVMFNGKPLSVGDLMPLLDATRAVLDPDQAELAGPSVPPPPASDGDLQNEIARRFAELDTRDWGDDHGFVATYGTDPETDAFVDAVADMVQQTRIELSEARHDVEQLEERVAEQREINQGWAAYGERVKAERASLGDKLIDVLGLREQRVGRHFDRLVPQACEEITRLRSDLDRARARGMQEQAQAYTRDLLSALNLAMPNRPLTVVWTDLLDIVRQQETRRASLATSAMRDREEVKAARAALARFAGSIPDDAAVNRAAVRMLRVHVYGTLPSERYDASALNQWRKVLEEEDRETWRRLARELLADLGATPTTGPEAAGADQTNPSKAGLSGTGVQGFPTAKRQTNTGTAPVASPLGAGAVVRIKRDVNIVPAGTIGLVIGQAANGPYRYTVMFPGDPYPYSVAAKDMDVVRGLDPQSWWKPTATPAAPGETDLSNDEEAVT